MESKTIKSKSDNLDELFPESDTDKHNRLLKEVNLAHIANSREKDWSPDEVREKIRNSDGIRAVTVCFSDAEGKLHALDYDKEFILGKGDEMGAEGNLTFDGSSVNGLSTLNQSDLRLKLDWKSLRFPPAEAFGDAKVLIFANICNDDGSLYEGDHRANLQRVVEEYEEIGYVFNFASEIEGFLLKGENAELSELPLEAASSGGYYNTLPNDDLRQFIDAQAGVIRALGFGNEKDHGEVAPSQFEINYKYAETMRAADQVQLYKQSARQVAANQGKTASFMPKPFSGQNGSGMHTNISVSKSGENIFYDVDGKFKLSEEALLFIGGIREKAMEICLAMNSSVNSYRRLDPNYEAPNEVKVSDSDRGSMIRIPMGNKNSARMEVRSVAPDSNPYLLYTLLIRAGMESLLEKDPGKRKEVVESVKNGDSLGILPSNIQEAIEAFEESDFVEDVIGKDAKEKFVDLKKEVADRSPKKLGEKVKSEELRGHHEVRTQESWADF